MSIYLNDKEIAKQLGVDSAKWESIAVVLERDGLPRRDPLFDERRCWPAVLEFLLRRAGVGGNNAAALVQNGGQYNGFKSKAARPNTPAKQKREGATVLALHSRRSEDGLPTNDSPAA
jgi:hypothetical protein